MMKRLLTPVASALLLLTASCAGSRLASQADQSDDVYYTKASARQKEEVTQTREAAKSEKKSEYVTDEQLYGDVYNNRDEDDDYYDHDYSARIHRFRNYSPWRGYYDNWYLDRYDLYSPYSYYDVRRPSFGIYVGLGNSYGYYSPFDYYYSPWNYYYNPWRYYGHQYYGNYWGPYSYYNPYYGSGYYGGYYNPFPAYRSPTYRPRPVRGFENIENVNQRNTANPGAVKTDGQGRILDTRSRAERYSEPSQSGTNEATRTRSWEGNTREARPDRVRDNQPRREERAPERSRQPETKSQPATENRPARTERPERTERYSPPPQTDRQSSQPSNNNNSERSRDDSNKPRPRRDK